MPTHARFAQMPFLEEMLDERVQTVGIAALERRVCAGELCEMP